MPGLFPGMSNVELSSVARLAAIGGTRRMIANDEFSVLAALLVDCGAVPNNVMAAALDRLSDHLIAKARGEMESDYAIYPSEIFDRARELTAHATALRARAR